jgi:hypothetical protein
VIVAMQEERGMSSDHDDLRATQESIAADARRIRELEERKRSLAADDPAAEELSAEVESVTSDLRRKARLQRELSEQIEPDADVHASAEYRRHLAAVLTERALRQAGRAALKRSRGTDG